MKPKSKRVKWLTIISLIVLIGGSILIIFLDRAREKSVSKQLSIIANSVTMAVNPDRIINLKGDLTDKNNPDYQRLREQLQKVAQAIKEEGVKWIYTMKMVDGKIIFLVDSVPEGEFGHSEPGDEYKNPPQEFKTVFAEGKLLVTSVYTDQWGKFVSILIPIKDFNSGEIVSVIGFDIDYSFWKSQINKTRIMAEGVIMLVWVLIIALYLFFSTRFEKSRDLIESEERFKVITESTLDPIIMMDKNGLIVLWNQAAEKVFGYTKTEAIGKSLHHLIIPPQKYNVEHSEKLNTFAQTGQSPVFGQVLELETISKSGQSIDIELSISGVKIKGQDYAIGVIRDISIRKENEKLLNEKNKAMENQQKAILNILEDVEASKNDLDKFKMAVDGASDHIVITDSDGIILYANQAVETITGFSKTEVVGKKVGNKNLWGGLMTLPFYKKLWKSIKLDKKAFTGEINNRKKDGQLYVAMASISPVLNNKNEVIYFVGIERDITHEKEVDRMKTDFISLASHQLRTPLSAIRWFGEMLLNGDAGKLTKDQKEYITNIALSNERMISLVNSLLNISRIESGRIIIDPEPTDLGKLIKDVLVEIDNKIKEKKQEIIISIHSNLPKINVDPKLIREVYKNLLTNANKYTQIGGEISIFISKKDHEIISQISDNGYGIPKKDQAKIFDKFYRAENIVKLETEGTGLGLYLAKSIVESSSGKIWFESKEKVGTTFWFTLPLLGVKAKKGEVTINS